MEVICNNPEAWGPFPFGIDTWDGICIFHRTVQPVWLQLCCKSHAGNTRECFKNIPICLGLAAEPVWMGGKKKRNLLQNSVSSLVKGIYFILNVIPPKQILFLNLSLSLEGLEQRAALGCCRPGCALSVARLGGGRTGQGNPIPGKRAQRWSCRGQGLVCQIQRVWGVSISSRHCPQPSQGWAPVGAESDPNPMQTPTPALLGAALFYFTIALFLYTIYEIEVYIYKFI